VAITERPSFREAVALGQQFGFVQAVAEYLSASWPRPTTWLIAFDPPLDLCRHLLNVDTDERPREARPPSPPASLPRRLAARAYLLTNHTTCLSVSRSGSDAAGPPHYGAKHGPRAIRSSRGHIARAGRPGTCRTVSRPTSTSRQPVLPRIVSRAPLPSISRPIRLRVILPNRVGRGQLGAESKAAQWVKIH
jgi:hypothetical protein